MPHLEFSHTIPRELVHRRSIAEVFVTSDAQLDDVHYEFGAQLPRLHAFYSDTFSSGALYSGTGPRHDPLLVFEVCRQASILLAHRYFAVPFDQYFVLRSMRTTVLDHDALGVAAEPADAHVTCEVVRRYVREATLTGADLHFGVRVGHCAAVAVDFSYSWVPPQVWARSRRSGRKRLRLGSTVRAAPVGVRAEPEAVGRRHPFNVVIGPPRTGADGQARARLVVDTGHPALFDHPLDHVPAMLQLEACRQLSTAAVGAAAPYEDIGLDAVSARFAEFVELDLPTECVARFEPVASDGVRHRFRCVCTLVQRGRAAAEAALELSVAAPESVVRLQPLGS